MSIGIPSAEESRLGVIPWSGLEVGSAVMVALPLPSRGAVTLLQSNLLAFDDEKGTSLMEKGATIKGNWDERGHQLFVTMRTPRLPTAGAQQLRVKARLLIEEPVPGNNLRASLAPGETLSLAWLLGNLKVVRKDGVTPLSFDGTTSQPVTQVSIEELEGVERHLGEPRFTVEGKDLPRGTVTKSHSLSGGKMKSSISYLLPLSDRPIELELPIHGAKVRSIEVEVVAGLGQG